jgi:HEAT repeat protein
VAEKINFQESLAKIIDTKQPFSTGALYAFSNLEPENQARFEAAWPRIDVERRRRVVMSLVELAEDDIELEFTSVYFFLLKDQDPKVRGKAIDGLWEDESRELLARLLEMVAKDPDAGVREKVALGLGRFAYLAETGKLKERWATRVRQGLFDRLHSDDSDISRRALEALGYFGHDDQVIRAVQEGYNSDDELIKASALKAMGRSINKRWLPEIGKELGSEEPSLRYEAAMAAGEMSADELTQPVIRLVEDEDREVQLAAIWALGQIGGSESSRTLKAVSNGEDEVLANAANEALTELAFASNPLNATNNR